MIKLLKSTRILITITLIMLLFFVGCTDAKKARIGSYGQEFKIELIDCEGNASRTWISSGTVSKEGNASGYYFLDKETQKFVRVMGTIVVTEL